MEREDAKGRWVRRPQKKPGICPALLYLALLLAPPHGAYFKEEWIAKQDEVVLR
jgi:hypothetical protein